MSDDEDESGQANKAAEFIVPPPFDASSPGDYYLLSTDDVHFRVLRSTLFHSTPYFEKLFQETPPSTSPNEPPGAPALPTFKFPEPARTLHALLILLYPVHAPEHIKVSDLQDIIDRQDKYAIAITTMMFITAMVLGRNFYADAPAEDPLALYAIAWSGGYRQEAKHFSRWLHRTDLTHAPTVDTLLKNAGSSKALIALTELRRLREVALDSVLEALEPKRHFCAAHASSDVMFFAFCSMMKTAARNALLEARLVVEDAFEFLGLQGAEEDGGRRRTVVWCSECYAKADKRRLTVQLREALEKYPQVIAIMPDNDVWGQFH